MDLKQRDPKQIVGDGYTRIAERYFAWCQEVRKEERAKYTSVLLERLAPGAAVLELGCGAGVPVTARLVERFSVTGVDLSARQITLARRNVPAATFVHADMTRLELAPASFDAVAAFYSLIHVPRQEHARLLRNAATWLRPGGLLVATLWPRSIEAELAEDWHGAPMYWSGFDTKTNLQLIAEAGLRLLSAEEGTVEEFGEPVTFLWVIAEKPI